MPRGKKIATDEKIIQAVISLGLQGVDISYRNIISHVGGGSNDTVKPVFHELERLGEGSPFIGAFRYLSDTEVSSSSGNLEVVNQQINPIDEKNNSETLHQECLLPQDDKNYAQASESAENLFSDLQLSFNEIETQWNVNFETAEKFIQQSRSFLNKVVLEKQSLYSEVDELYRHIKRIKDIISQSG